MRSFGGGSVGCLAVIIWVFALLAALAIVLVLRVIGAVLLLIAAIAVTAFVFWRRW